MHILAFKMSNGDEIIAKVEDESGSVDNKKFVISKPLALRMQMTQAGAQMGFFPWTLLLSDSDSIELNSNHIIASYDPSKEVTDNYVKNITGIEIATSVPKILHS